MSSYYSTMGRSRALLHKHLESKTLHTGLAHGRPYPRKEIGQGPRRIHKRGVAQRLSAHDHHFVTLSNMTWDFASRFAQRQTLNLDNLHARVIVEGRAGRDLLLKAILNLTYYHPPLLLCTTFHNGPGINLAMAGVRRNTVTSPSSYSWCDRHGAHRLYPIQLCRGNAKEILCLMALGSRREFGSWVLLLMCFTSQEAPISSGYGVVCFETRYSQTLEDTQDIEHYFTKEHKTSSLSPSISNGTTLNPEDAEEKMMQKENRVD
ncbi:hypothetical protein EDD85DRAFT_943200 [Armillaria nabsnona]|nr:hypothetical protein EDD85DRAFT_943200 [Armillaria nabsnona]